MCHPKLNENSIDNMTKKLTILGIETSCDETAAAVYHTDLGILSSKLFSQIEQQKNYGGVVPEIASRTHVEKIEPIISEALAAANKTLQDIDVIAVTNKPGLPGSLLVGVCFAKSLAYSLNIPIIGVNHLEGHAFSSFIEHTPPFPHLCLTASGGHSSIYLITDYGNYQTIGQTTDDAAGEAFDKIAKLIGLPYPGGPEIEKLASQVEFQDFFAYSRPKKPSLDFSFSGLKTAVLYDLVKRGYYELSSKTLLNHSLDLKQQVSSSLLVAIRDIFIEKLALATKQYPNIKSISFVGGVACNKYLKNSLAEFCQQNKLEFFSPSPKYCTDNAAMIALVGHYKAQSGLFDGLDLDIF
jgi:N6-L-threonylcarbamoyladenine synthase